MAADPSEFELIAALRERAARAGAPPRSPRLVVASGDDAAVSAREGAAVTSVDALVEDVHFDRAHFPLRAVGHKALAAALSDLAAMGAEPGEAYVQLMLPDDVGPQGCLELADGLAALAAARRVAIAGGDVSRAAILAVALTVVGYVGAPEQAVLRSGASAGDAVVVTGEVGGAAAGLLALGDPDLCAGLAPEVAGRLRRRQLEPEPRIDAGRALARAGASALIDLSDGLGADAGQIAAASGVRIAIELARMPVQAGVAELAAAAGCDPLDLAAGGGEDYELLATVPRERLAGAHAALAELGLRLSELGEVCEGSGVELTDPLGTARRPAGYDQLAPRSVPGARS